MSNNYNTTLQSNNTDLQAILNTINELPEGGDITLQDKTVTPSTSQQTVTADSGYDGLDTVTVNAMPTATQATPSITINSSGLITATATQTAGYVAAGTKSATKQLAFQAAKTITPSTTSQTAVSSGYYTGGNITVAAIPSTYIVPAGIKTITENGTYDVKSYASATVNVESGGGGDTTQEDGLITGTLTSYTNSRVTTIAGGAFHGKTGLTTINLPNCSIIQSGYMSGDFYYGAFGYCSSLKSASFPVCTTIGSYAFYYCSSLKSASFPACTTIASYAFYKCSKLTSVSFPVCTTIASYAFEDCTQLTSVSFPDCTTIGSRAFYNCTQLTSASFPACTTIGSGAFGYCLALTSVSFPVCTTIGTGFGGAFHDCPQLTSASFPAGTTIGDEAFCDCTQLTSVSFPVCTTIGNWAFYNCTQLTSVSFPAGTTIGSRAFYYCSSLKSIYLLASVVCTLSHSNAFSYTSIWSNKGSIFVPASLVSSYKTATNWTFFSNRIFSYVEQSGSGGGSA